MLVLVFLFSDEAASVSSSEGKRDPDHTLKKTIYICNFYELFYTPASSSGKALQ